MKKSLPAFTLALIAGAIAIDAADLQSVATGAQAATALVYTPPSYRIQPLVNRPQGTDREALVYLRATISEKGFIKNVELVEGGFHDSTFVRAAMEAARDALMNPATLGGKPIVDTAIMTFAFKGGACPTPAGAVGCGWLKGISEKFRIEMQKVEQLFEQKDYVSANQLATKLRKQVKLASEFTALNALLAQINARIGRDLDALEAVMAATARVTRDSNRFMPGQPVPPNSASNYLLPKELLLPLLELRMQLAARNGYLLVAAYTYQELAGLVTLSADDPRSVLAAQVTAKLESNEPLTAKGTMAEANTWSWALSRRSFTLRNVQGNVESLLLYCRGGKTKLQYKPGEEWTVPADSDDCTVTVEGKQGTSFEFVEFTGQ